MSSPPEGLNVIGVVRSARTDPAYTPVQSSLNPDEDAAVHIDAAFADGLDGLDGFDYAWLLTWLARPDDPPARSAPLRHVPFLLRRQPREIGIFATRGPRRINPIGLSLIRVLEVSGSIVRFSGVDVVDRTPVVDLKPYVTAFDRPPTAPRCGWLDEVTLPVGATPASLRPPT
jgi:tRNA-Thr(GGU) m(6)t(6)A37 methyltransferase TsaA